MGRKKINNKHKQIQNTQT